MDRKLKAKGSEAAVDCCGASAAAFSVRSRSLPRTARLSEILPNPDHTAHVKRLNRVVGQLLGVKKMIEDRRYCPDILNQTRAAASALKAVELLILESHLRHCVSEAIQSPDAAEAAAKIEELIDVVGRF
jgi:CsoR family transcriptional regulator, copper-sensing transcriptional repressor